ncbi:Hint domain-containing protein [Leeia oryzae]|uniref:Hint domain-containing protein n=1 Tax=Leeia oryzae TaxID=356662 RepID=UPI00036CDBFC|nr:Hint domain-containing protein [Leeia oryzae]
MAILPSATCFAKGTRILTDKGEKPIEDLTVGDSVITSSGITPLKWIGKRHIVFNLLSEQDAFLNRPVHISARSLTDHLPTTDLVISWGHSVFHDEQLVTAGSLVGKPGVSVLGTLPEITYYHLEFDRWEILLANGLPAESYVDDGNRILFDNHAEWLRQTSPHAIKDREPEFV